MRLSAARTSHGSTHVGCARDRLEHCFVRLATLLAESDGEALRVLSSEAPMLRPALGADFHALEKAVNGFDFDSALACLKSSASRHNVRL